MQSDPHALNTIATTPLSDAFTAPDIRAKLRAQLMEPIPTSHGEFRARIDADIARWSPVIRAANIRIN